MKFTIRRSGVYNFIAVTDAKCKGVAAIPYKDGSRPKTIKNVCGNLISAYDERRQIVRITGLVVGSEAQRGILGLKVATALYERAAKDACSKYKVPLASDVSRSDRAQSFWEKQVAKGRATWKKFEQDADFDNRAVLSCPAPKSLAGKRRNVK